MAIKGEDDFDEWAYRKDDTIRDLAQIVVSASDQQWRNTEVRALYGIKNEITALATKFAARMKALEDKKMIDIGDVARIAQREFQDTKDKVEELRDGNKWVTRGLLAAFGTLLLLIGGFIATKVLK